MLTQWLGIPAARLVRDLRDNPNLGRRISPHGLGDPLREERRGLRSAIPGDEIGKHLPRDCPLALTWYAEGTMCPK